MLVVLGGVGPQPSHDHRAGEPSMSAWINTKLLLSSNCVRVLGVVCHLINGLRLIVLFPVSPLTWKPVCVNSLKIERRATGPIMKTSEPRWRICSSSIALTYLLWRGHRRLGLLLWALKRQGIIRRSHAAAQAFWRLTEKRPLGSIIRRQASRSPLLKMTH